LRIALNRRFFNRGQQGFRRFLQAIIDRHGHAALLRGCRVSVRNIRVFPHNAAAKANEMNERTGTRCGLLFLVLIDIFGISCCQNMGDFHGT
jgi:hypothetical protein